MGILTFHCRANSAAESLLSEITCFKRRLSICDSSMKIFKNLLFIFKDGLYERVVCLFFFFKESFNLTDLTVV